jgi:hypothetical protein
MVQRPAKKTPAPKRADAAPEVNFFSSFDRPLIETNKKEKRGFCVPMKRSRGSYAAGGTSPEVKEYRAKLAAALKRRGVSLDVFLEANNEAGFPV